MPDIEAAMLGYDGIAGLVRLRRSADSSGDLRTDGAGVRLLADRVVVAIDHADQVTYDRLPPELAERRTSHLIALAWAHYLRRHDREALDTLKSARAAAPEQLIFTRRVHSMLLGMLRRERRSTRHDLREMADFVGVAA